MKIKVADLQKKVFATLSKNFSEEESKRMAEPLIWAEMADIKPMGIAKLTGTEPLQNVKPKYPIKIDRDTKLSQLIDAGANPATLVCQIATDTVIKKAKENGFGIVGVHNTFSSNTSQAFYVERIAKENLIGIMCSRSPASTTGFDSIDPIFGTNPIGVAFPTKEEPVVFDMASSAMTFYGLVLAKARGQKISENMAIDPKGKPTTDPEKAMNGALLPFDRSYKGSGILMMVEMLAGPLVNSSWVDNKTFKEEWGSLFIAIDPNLLVDVKKFKENCSDLIKKVKNSRKRKGVSEIRIPGEHSRANYNKSMESGYVEVDDAILKELKYI